MSSIDFDINCDLGEGYGNDAEIMPLIGSCNIACGGHFGNLQTMTEALQLAKKHQVHAGAHPSYPDWQNFGRKSMQISKKELIDSICQQIKQFQKACDRTQTPMHHVKLHGALYNDAAKDKEIAKRVLQAFQMSCPGTLIYAPYRSELAELVRDDFEVWEEAFIDRSYNQDYSLVDRSHPKALLTRAEDCLSQLQSMSCEHQLRTIDGKVLSMHAQTFCIHGDQPGSLEILKFIHSKLKHKRL